MPLFSDCDLAGMLEQVGIPVVVAGRTVNAIVRFNDVAFGDEPAELAGKMVSLTLLTSDVGDAENGKEIVEVKGVTYRIRRSLQVSDGLITKLHLVRS